MKKLLTLFALLGAVASVGVTALVAQNTQTTQKPSHEITDEDIQQRYHSDSSNTSQTTDTSTTDQTDKNTQTDQTDKSTEKTDEGNDLDSLKKRLEGKQKELDGLKSEHESLVALGKTIQENLDKADSAGKDQFQNSLDDNNASLKSNEEKQKKLEGEISELKDQIKAGEENNTDTTTSKTDNSNQTENTTPPQNRQR
jgi:chromosome segregation ATPase